MPIILLTVLLFDFKLNRISLFNWYDDFPLFYVGIDRIDIKR